MVDAVVLDVASLGRSPAVDDACAVRAGAVLP